MSGVTALTLAVLFSSAAAITIQKQGILEHPEVELAEPNKHAKLKVSERDRPHPLPSHVAFGHAAADGYTHASATSYWDCSYMHCAGFMKDIEKNQGKCHTEELSAGLHTGENHSHWKTGLFEENGQIFGTAAGGSSFGLSEFSAGLESNSACGSCYHVKLNHLAQPVSMTLMMTNWCKECDNKDADSQHGAYHLNIATPGGGQGTHPNCAHQHPNNYQAFSKLTDIGQCSGLPQEYQESCRIWHGKVGDEAGYLWQAQFKKVGCPQELLTRLGCSA